VAVVLPSRRPTHSWITLLTFFYCIFFVCAKGHVHTHTYARALIHGYTGTCAIETFALYYYSCKYAYLSSWTWSCESAIKLRVWITRWRFIHTDNKQGVCSPLGRHCIDRFDPLSCPLTSLRWPTTSKNVFSFFWSKAQKLSLYRFNKLEYIHQISLANIL
jgi:hypothetical protein